MSKRQPIPSNNNAGTKKVKLADDSFVEIEMRSSVQETKEKKLLDDDSDDEELYIRATQIEERERQRLDVFSQMTYDDFVAPSTSTQQPKVPIIDLTTGTSTQTANANEGKLRMLQNKCAALERQLKKVRPNYAEATFRANEMNELRERIKQLMNENDAFKCEKLKKIENMSNDEQGLRAENENLKKKLAAFKAVVKLKTHEKIPANEQQLQRVSTSNEDDDAGVNEGLRIKNLLKDPKKMEDHGKYLEMARMFEDLCTHVSLSDKYREFGVKVMAYGGSARVIIEQSDIDDGSSENDNKLSRLNSNPQNYVASDRNNLRITRSESKASDKSVKNKSLSLGIKRKVIQNENVNLKNIKSSEKNQNLPSSSNFSKFKQIHLPSILKNHKNNEFKLTPTKNQPRILTLHENQRLPSSLIDYYHRKANFISNPSLSHFFPTLQFIMNTRHTQVMQISQPADDLINTFNLVAVIITRIAESIKNTESRRYNQLFTKQEFAMKQTACISEEYFADDDFRPNAIDAELMRISEHNPLVQCGKMYEKEQLVDERRLIAMIAELCAVSTPLSEMIMTQVIDVNNNRTLIHEICDFIDPYILESRLFYQNGSLALALSELLVSLSSHYIDFPDDEAIDDNFLMFFHHLLMMTTSRARVLTNLAQFILNAGRKCDFKLVSRLCKSFPTSSENFSEKCRLYQVPRYGCQLQIYSLLLSTAFLFKDDVPAHKIGDLYDLTIKINAVTQLFLANSTSMEFLRPAEGTGRQDGIKDHCNCYQHFVTAVMILNEQSIRHRSVDFDEREFIILFNKMF